MKTVYCPVKDGQINGDDCYLICDIADGLIKSRVLPEGVTWDEDQRQKCLKCKYHADLAGNENESETVSLENQ